MKLVSPVVPALLAVSAGAPAGAFASDVLVVDPTGAGDHRRIDDATQAAGVGDVVLVRAGTHVERVSVSRGMTIVADGPVRIDGSIGVADVPSGDFVLLAGLDVVQPPISQTTRLGAVEVLRCSGPVRLVDCELEGWDGEEVMSWILPGGPGLHAAQSADVAAIECQILGGNGGIGFLWGSSPAWGGPGVEASDVAFLTLMRSLVVGGYGEGVDLGGDGGHALMLEGSCIVDLSYSALLGGEGGFGIFGACGGAGGHGIVASGQLVRRLGGVLDGGTAGDPATCGSSVDGAPSVGTTPVVLQGHPSSLGLPLTVRRGDPVVAEVAGVAGDRGRVHVRNDTGRRFSGPLLQPWLLRRWMPLVPYAAPFTIDGTGQATVPLGNAPLSGGRDAAVYWLQGRIGDGSGVPRATSARPLIVLDPAL
ncbi:MAG: hypothetical protein AAF957_02205 [Planctomycetota bacterium]